MSEELIKRVIGEEITCFFEPGRRLEIVIPADREFEIIPQTAPILEGYIVALHVKLSKTEFDIANFNGDIWVGNDSVKVKLFRGSFGIKVGENMIKIVAESGE